MADDKGIDFQLELEGVEELQRKFKLMEVELGALIADATSEAAAVVVREAALNSKKGGYHGERVSDEFPMLWFGNLFRSIKELRTITTPFSVESQVGSDMIYARRLELGYADTDKKGRTFHQRPRPFLRPALDDNKAEIQLAFELKIKKMCEGLL